jgi:fibronectin type 3 domain-containing protein
MDTLVWILGAIFLVNVLAVGWLVTLEFVERRRLDKEIRQVDAMWRYLTTPLSATVAWGARGRVGGRHRATAVRGQPAPAAGKAWIGLAVAATVVWVAAVTLGPPGQRLITSADGFVIPRVTPELEVHRHGVSSTPGVKNDGTRVSTLAPSQASSNTSDTSFATSNDETVPATVAAQPHSSTQIYLEWDEVRVATGYSVERKTEDSQQGWLTIVKVQEDVTDYTDDGLAAETTYFYRVSALTDSGTAPPSDVVSATTPIRVPAATNVTAVATLDTIALTWADVDGETGYRVERSLDGATDWIEIATTGQDVTTYINATLSPGTTYYYRIVATNAGGDSAPSNIASATTEPAPPDIEGTAPATDAPAAGGASAEGDPSATGGALAEGDPSATGGALAEGDPSATEGIESAAPTQ